MASAPLRAIANAESSSGESSTAILAVGPTPKAFGVELVTTRINAHNDENDSARDVR